MNNHKTSIENAITSMDIQPYQYNTKIHITVYGILFLLQKAVISSRSFKDTSNTKYLMMSSPFNISLCNLQSKPFAKMNENTLNTAQENLTAITAISLNSVI